MEAKLEILCQMLVFIAASGLLLAILQIIYQAIYYQFFHPLRHYPGPFWAGVTRLVYAWHSFRGSNREFQYNAVKQYGSIVRITPTMIMFADTSMIPNVYHRRDTKSRFYPDCLVDEPGLLLLRDPQRHSTQRRLLGAPYALSNIQKLEPIIEKHILKWLDTINFRYAQQKKPLNLPEWATFLSYDTLTDLTFRNPLGFIDKGSDVDGLIKNLRLGGRIISAVCSLYTILEFVATTWVRSLLMVRPGMGLGPRRVMTKASEVLQERAEALAENRTIKPVKGSHAYDFLQAMMDARNPDGHFMTAERIQTELFVIMSAGTDGFGSTASGFMVEVLSHPTILERVLAEIKGAAEAGKLSYPVPTYAEVAQHLPFFVACVNESLRLHPLTSSLLPREVTVNDPELVVNGRVVPIGTEVACNAWICGRDRALYGPDAEEYNPDRWLSDPERAKTYEKYNFSWGYGSRTCIGKHLATTMLYKSLVALFMKFRVTVCEESWQTPKPSNRLSGPNLLWENVWLDLEERRFCHSDDAEDSPSVSPDTCEGIENSGDKSAEVVRSRR